MPRTILWLGALIAVGWLSSPAFAFRGLFRGSQSAVVSSDVPAPPGTTIVNGEITNGTPNAGVTTDCSGGRHGICGGHLGGLCGKLDSAKQHIHAWLLDVPQKQPPPAAPPIPINPWIRSPRDYFMVGDP